jgi:hypothetical protein
MDMHVAPDPEMAPDPGPGGMSARLPDEAQDGSLPIEGAAPIGESAPIGDLEVRERPPSSAINPSHRRRRLLLAGVAVAAVAIAGGAFLVSPYNTLYPLPRIQASVTNAAGNASRYAQTTLRPLLAPAASLAKVAVPPVPPTTRDAYKPKPPDQQVAEILSLHPGTPSQIDNATRLGDPDGHPAKGPAAKPAPAVAVSGADAPGGDVPHEPGSSSASRPGVAPASLPAPPAIGSAAPAAGAPRDATAAVIASLPQPQPTPQDAPKAPQLAVAPMPVAVPQAPATQTGETQRSLPPGSPRDAVFEATNLRAGPMSAPEQVQVLNLVTEMAAMVKDLRKQQAQLRSDLAKSSTDTSARLADYERRLALAEARSAVTAAGDAPDSAAAKPVALLNDPASPTSKAIPTPIPIASARPFAVVASPLVPPAPKLYRVQAASPGLALLAQVDRGGGDGAQMQVVVGDTVPDYGRVTSIAQKGTAWVVMTERGPIQ